MILRAALIAVLIAACGGPSPPAPPPTSLLPADYLQRFVVVRDCRRSAEHPFAMVIRTEPAHAAIYNGGPFPFPPGALLVKEEYAEPSCAAPLQYTLMRKEAAGYDPDFGDWRWQRIDGVGKVIEDGKGSALPRCASCHVRAACRARDLTCADP